MNPIHTIRHAYTTLSGRIAETVDRLVSQDRDRETRRASYEAEIRRRHQQIERPARHD